MKRLRCALAVVGALLLAACTSTGGTSVAKPSGLNDNPGTGRYHGMALVPPEPRPSFTLTDTSGAAFDFRAKTAGTATLLFFGYTTCPDYCPATMADIGEALGSLPMSTQQKVDVVFVSTDVKHDTGSIIATWLKNFSAMSHSTFIGLHGTQAQIDAAQASAHIFLAQDDGQTHSTQVLLVGSDDYTRDSFVFNADTEQAQIAQDVPLVIGA